MSQCPEFSQGAQVQSAQGREEHARASWWALYKQGLGFNSHFDLGDASGTVSPEMGCVDGHKPENTAPLLLQADLGLLMSGRKIAEPLSCQYLVLCE